MKKIMETRRRREKVTGQLRTKIWNKEDDVLCSESEREMVLFVFLKKKKKGEGRWTWWRLGCLNDGGRREDQIVIGFFSFISYSLLLPLALSFVSVFRCSEIPFLYVSSWFFFFSFLDFWIVIFVSFKNRVYYPVS
jgi:hypothetical protein